MHKFMGLKGSLIAFERKYFIRVDGEVFANDKG